MWARVWERGLIVGRIFKNPWWPNALEVKHLAWMQPKPKTEFIFIQLFFLYVGEVCNAWESIRGYISFLLSGAWFQDCELVGNKEQCCYFVQVPVVLIILDISFWNTPHKYWDLNYLFYYYFMFIVGFRVIITYLLKEG